jgi:nucleoside-diphosphate-sugar epimerase
MTDERNYILVNGASGFLGRAILQRLRLQRTLQGGRNANAFERNGIAIGSDGTIDPVQLWNVETIVNCVGKVKGTRDTVWEANVTHPVRLATIAKVAGVRRFVQISSFSIFGDVSFIGAETLISPTNVYGLSKTQAEQALMALQDENFIVICVRFPIIFGCQNSPLIDILIKFLKISSVFPLKRTAVKRSMITYHDAADIIADVCTMECSGPVFAADTNLFSFQLLFDILENAGISVACPIFIPNVFAKLVKCFLPSLGVRLFNSSVLDDNVNLLTHREIDRGIYKELQLIAQRS